MERLSDEQLFSAVVEGEIAALTPLVERYQQPLTGYLDRLLLLVLSTGHLDILLSLSGELLLGGVGVVMLAITLWRFTLQIPRHLLATAP